MFWWISVISASAATATLYATRFEVAEGFSTNATLAGQGGWTKAGSGGNGIVTNYILGLGQQAYIGYFAPAAGDTALAVWKPVNFAPNNASLVHFSVEMSVIDSSTNQNGLNRDEFYWTVYNNAGDRLFGVLFDNYDLSIWHELDDGFIYDTGWSFENEESYTLEVTMNFSASRWGATLNGTQIVTNQLITTKGAARSFGDADAEWVLGITNKPGNNYLIFDNYTVTADALPSVVPSVQSPVTVAGGQKQIRVSGKNNAAYAIEGSTNLVKWTSLRKNVANSSGYFDYTDTNAPALKQRFYRARWVP